MSRKHTEGQTMLFKKVEHSRRATSRASSDVRARIVHTSHQKRRLDLFIPQVVYASLGWEIGGFLSISYALAPERLVVRIGPAHKGVRMTRVATKSACGRICISGSFINQAGCALRRAVPFMVEHGALVVTLPIAWASLPNTSNCEVVS